MSVNLQQTFSVWYKILQNILKKKKSTKDHGTITNLFEKIKLNLDKLISVNLTNST